MYKTRISTDEPRTEKPWVEVVSNFLQVMFQLTILYLQPMLPPKKKDT